MPGKASMVLCRDADVNQFEEDDGATPVICLKEQGEVRIIIYFIIIFSKLNYHYQNY